MATKRRYGIYCALDEEVSAYTRALVREIAERFDLHYTLKQNIHPHFTLKYFFETDNITPLDELTEQFCHEHTKTKVRIGGFKSFPPDVWFLDVKLSPEAQLTFDRYTQMLREQSWMQWHEFDVPNLVFHVTFAEKCPEKYEAIKAYLSGREKYFDTWFNNITILYQDGGEDGIEKWTVHKTFEMK